MMGLWGLSRLGARTLRCSDPVVIKSVVLPLRACGLVPMASNLRIVHFIESKFSLNGRSPFLSEFHHFRLHQCHGFAED